MRELVSLLNQASKAYYAEDEEMMSNFEYDRLYDELTALEKELGVTFADSPTVQVGYEAVDELPKERHESAMLSLAKTKSREELAAWLNGKTGLLSWKLDGLTIVLTYRDGALQKAVTRGNGEVGEVVTGNARVFKNLPLAIPYQGELILRGEAVITYSGFEKINREIEDEQAKYKNPRNLCSGSVRQLDNRITAQRGVCFYAFSLVRADVDFHNSRAAQFAFLQEQGFDVVEHRLVTPEDILDNISYFEEKIQNLIQTLEKHPNVILFIDEIHQMIGAGKSEGSIDVSSVLKPYLARGVIKCIGATTLDEYEKYIEKDRALERRFQIIHVKEPDKLTCETMIISKIDEYEAFHQVTIPQKIVHQMIEYCDYYMPQRKFPDKAIDVLDLSCVHAKRLKDKTVDDGIVRKVIEQLTAIPLESNDRLCAVRHRLEERIVAQRSIIERLMRQLSWIEQGVICDRPLGVWLFCGDSCCGKKTVMKEFTRAYFNQEELLELDISTMESSLPHV